MPARGSSWLVAAVLCLPACAATRSDDAAREDVGVARELLTVDPSVSDRAVVADDHVELPSDAFANGDALAPGRILAAGPSHLDDNPHGFLRRVKSVTRAGDKLVVATDRAGLDEAFLGDVTIDNVDVRLPTHEVGDPTASSPALSGQSWSDAIASKILFQGGALVFRETIGKYIDPVHPNGTLDVSASVDHGYMDFEPGVTTSLHLSHGHVQELELLASGTMDAELALKIDVSADTTLDTASTGDGGWTEPRHVDIRLHRFPRARWFEMVGFVPVWEALEASIVLRCDFAFKGEFHGVVGFDASGAFSAGAEYTDAGGPRALHTGPTFAMTPIWNVPPESRSVSAKCSLEPEIALYVYDLAGPTLSAGPWLEATMDSAPPASTTWSFHLGARADVGGRVDILGNALFQERVPVFDQTFY